MSGQDPFAITGPAVISLSGGRTSGYMLRRVLDAHGGTLPDDVMVCFANTGREMPATLRFVEDMGRHWNVRIHWLEYRREAPTEDEASRWREERLARIAERLAKARSPKVRAKLERAAEVVWLRPPPGRIWAEEVGPNSASRNGEPFLQMIQAKNMLPNPVMRFCTAELKIRTIARFCRSVLGAGATWTEVIGLRADEPIRVERLTDPDNLKKRNRENRKISLPLAAAGVTKADVMAFWSASPFDLGLAGAWEGNCDGCFLKRRAALARMFQDHPERMQWWADVEAMGIGASVRNPSVGLFRKDAPRYSAIASAQVSQARLELDADDDGADVFASCDPGCGAG